MPSAYRKMLGARSLTNWTTIDIWRPPRVGAAHLTEQLPLDPDSEGELDSIVKRSIPVRRASQNRRVERSNPVARQSDSLIERGNTLSAPRFPGILAFPVVAKFRADCHCKALAHGIEGERGDVEVLFASHHLSQRLSDRGRVFEAVSRAW